MSPTSACCPYQLRLCHLEALDGWVGMYYDFPVQKTVPPELVERGVTDMTFGEKLQKLRRESSLSQEKLAEQLHVSRQAVSRRELGTAAPDVDNIVRLSKFFQVSLEYLMVEDCEEPVQAAAPTTPAPEGQRAEKPARRRKWLPLWLLITGVLLEALSYGLCYPMQERPF